MGNSTWFLLLLVWWSGDSSLCQEVTVTHVSSHYYELSWVPNNQWLGIENFAVTTVQEESHLHRFTKEVTCVTVVCTFKSSEYTLLDSCTSVNVNVTGGNYTVSKLFTTAPGKVENVIVNIESGNMTVSWDNPDAPVSTCMEATVVQLDFNKRVHTSEDTQGFYWRSLCMPGNGEVRLWNRGGDGESEVTTKHVIYEFDDTVLLIVDNLTAAVECNQITATWINHDVCTDATHFRVRAAPSGSYDVDFYTEDISTTSHVFTDLIFGNSYTIYVTPLDENNVTLQLSPSTFTRTDYETATNVTLEAVCSTVYVNWDPSHCCTNQTKYIIKMHGDNQYLSWEEYDTSFEYDNLTEDNSYFIYISTESHELPYYWFSTINNPYLVKVDESAGGLNVSWHYDNYRNLTLIYNVSWGADLENCASSSHTEYTIRGYNANEQERRVCVVAIDTDSGVVSCRSCEGDPYVPTTLSPPFPDPEVNKLLAVIIIMSILVILFLGMGVIGIILRCKKSRPTGDSPIIALDLGSTDSPSTERLRT